MGNDTREPPTPGPLPPNITRLVPKPSSAIPGRGTQEEHGAAWGPFPGGNPFLGGDTPPFGGHPPFWGTPPFGGPPPLSGDTQPAGGGMPAVGAHPRQSRLRALPAAAARSAPRPPRASAPPAPPRGERPREHQWEGPGRQAAPLIGCRPCIYQGAAEGERGGGGGGRGARRDPGGRCPPGGLRAMGRRGRARGG